jgi:F-type H+-transporting ATPase subunit b
MEILAVFGINWKIILIQMFNFGIVLLLLRRFLYRPLMNMLDERNAKLKRGLEDAASAALEREAIAIEKTEIVSAARAEGNAIVEGVRKDALERERALLREAEEKSAAILVEAKARAEEERTHILRESEKEVARMAVLAAEKILRERRTA